MLMVQPSRDDSCSLQGRGACCATSQAIRSPARAGGSHRAWDGVILPSAILLFALAMPGAAEAQQCWDCIALPGDSGMVDCNPTSAGFLACDRHCEDNWCICIPSGSCHGFAFLAPTPDGAIVLNFSSAEQPPRAALVSFGDCAARLTDGAWWTVMADGRDAGEVPSTARVANLTRNEPTRAEVAWRGPIRSRATR